MTECNFEWAKFHLSQGRKLRRECWPRRWRAWVMTEYLQSAGNIEDNKFWEHGLVCGWGSQIGLVGKVDEVMGMRDGRCYTPSILDRRAEDWELL